VFNAFTGIVRGRVQGVGFRFFTQKRANELKLKGWVRNLPDGTVEVWAQGAPLALEQFMHSLEVGPVGSWVEEAQFQWFQDDQELSRFEIRG
jgi:acylphosphatase